VSLGKFYSWTEDIQARVENHKDEEYSRYIQQMGSYSDSCEKLLQFIREFQENLNVTESNYQDVANRASNLHHDCSTMIRARDDLVNMADEIGKRLKLYDKLEEWTIFLNRPAVDVQSKEFLDLLGDLDAAIAHIKSHASHKESDVYLARFRQLQTLALGLIRNHVNGALKSLTLSMLGEETTIPPNTEASPFFTQWQSILPQVRPLIAALEQRSKFKGYFHILEDVYKCYYAQRATLLVLPCRKMLRAWMSGTLGAGSRAGTPTSQTDPEDIVAGREEKDEAPKSGGLRVLPHNLSAMELIQQGSPLFASFCGVETRLCRDFFAIDSAEKSQKYLRDYLESMTSPFVQQIRPIIISSHSIEELCVVIDALRMEIDETSHASARLIAGKSPFAPTAEKLIQDAQQRLTFQAVVIISSQIASFKTSSSSSSSSSSASGSDIIWPDAIYSHARPYHPAVDYTLGELSRLHGALEKAVFAGVAEEIMEVCMAAVTAASTQLSQSQGPLLSSLFLLYHTLALREGSRTFEVEMRLVEKSLDFSSTRHALGRLLSAGGNKGESTAASWFNLLSDSAPKLAEKWRSSSRDFDRILKGAGETVVLLTSTAASASLLTILNQVSSRRSTSTHGDADVGSLISEQSAATTLQECYDALHAGFYEALVLVCQFLQGKSVLLTLWKSIESAVLDAFVLFEDLCSKYKAWPAGDDRHLAVYREAVRKEYALAIAEAERRKVEAKSSA
jgi:conserved oligomeric Golgi complex subunit 3